MKEYKNQKVDKLIELMNAILYEADRMKEPTIPENIDRGYQVSADAMKQPQEVAMSPIMKNALKAFGDLKDGERLTVNHPATKAEAWFYDACVLLLNKFNGPKALEYNEDLPLLSSQHYTVQCWKNLKEGTEMRQIQPRMQEQREEFIKDYSVETPTVDIRKLLRYDPVFAKAVFMVMEMLPAVKASSDFIEINLPFMTKHTNVGAPFWQNDKNVKDGKTYAQITLDIAKRLSARQLMAYNLSTGYGRNQRGKGRLLIAVSRIVNLWFNRLEAKEIEAYKRKCPLFVGYNDDLKLREALNQMVDDAQRLGLKIRNMDQAGYDKHVSKQFIALLGAMSIERSNGSLSKEIAFWRAKFMAKTWLVDGLSKKVIPIYGRIFSGFIDTNRGGGIINAVITTYQCMKQDPNYSSYIYDLLYYMLVMGDDNCFLYKHFDSKQMEIGMDNLKFEVNTNKDEFGPMFLQYRLFEYEGKRVMLYAWTRVLRSILWKENTKGLGPAGWTLAIWQQLMKVYDPDCVAYMKILVNLLIPFDEYRLMIDKTVPEILAMVQEEDKKALREKRGSKAGTTADKLYDGDPQKQRFAKAVATGDEGGYLVTIHDLIKSLYDPQFLSQCGIGSPPKLRVSATDKA